MKKQEIEQLNQPTQEPQYSLRGEIKTRSGEKFIVDLGENFGLTNHGLQGTDVHQFMLINNKNFEERLFIQGDRIEYLVVSRVTK